MNSRLMMVMMMMMLQGFFSSCFKNTITRITASAAPLVANSWSDFRNLPLITLTTDIRSEIRTVAGVSLLFEYSLIPFPPPTLPTTLPKLKK